MKKLSDLRNVGKATLQDLHLLGVHTVEDLALFGMRRRIEINLMIGI